MQRYELLHNNMCNYCDFYSIYCENDCKNDKNIHIATELTKIIANFVPCLTNIVPLHNYSCTNQNHNND